MQQELREERVLDYRPEFQSRISRPSYQEMVKVHGVLRGAELKTSFWKELLTELSKTMRKYPEEKDLNRHILAVLGKGY